MDWLILVFLSFLHLYFQYIFFEKCWNIMIWFWYQIFFSFSCCCYKFNVSMFSNIFDGVSKNAFSINLKKIFFEIIFCIFKFFFKSVFISIYGFNKPFWLNLITLCTFFKTSPWFNACLNSLYEQHVQFSHVN